MTHVFNFLGVFFIIIFLVCIALFFLTKDDWYKMLFFVGSVFMFFLLLYFAHFQGNVDSGNSLVTHIDTLDDIDVTDFDYLGSDSITKSDDILSFNILTEEFEEDEYFNFYSDSLVNSEFCFAYNNTDASNVIRVNSGATAISDYFYIINNSAGETCIDINISFIRHGALMGIRCLDCSVGNTLNIPYLNGSEVDEVLINKINPLTYTVTKSPPHKIWLNNYYLPVDMTNKSVYIFNYALSIFTLLFGSRYLWKLFYDSEDGDGWNAF